MLLYCALQVRLQYLLYILVNALNLFLLFFGSFNTLLSDLVHELFAYIQLREVVLLRHFLLNWCFYIFELTKDDDLVLQIAVV
jgi:hypothetical protein